MKKDAFLESIKRIDEMGNQVGNDTQKFRGWQTAILAFLKVYSPIFDVQVELIENINLFYGLKPEHIKKIHEQIKSIILLVEIDAVPLVGTCSDKDERIEQILCRFRVVANQLKHRHNDRDTLTITDEYDVQNLLHALLKVDFDDVRPEEWTPSYAGGSVRMDFLLKEIDTVIEVKMTRSSMTPKSLGEELIIDIEKYQCHPNCRRLYCFVYDPEMRLCNPLGLKNDLESKHDGFLRVVITQ